MSVRRLGKEQPASFSFTPENEAWAEATIRKYPPGREASAIIPLFWRAQEQCGGWLPEPAINAIGQRLGMTYIRAVEVATFYTMFNLEPVGKHLIQVCTTTPCWLRGSDAVVAACKKHIHPKQNTISADGVFSWMEVECLGGCANAPVVQIASDYYEDLDGPAMERILETLRAGGTPKAGSAIGRVSSEPHGHVTTLTEVTH